MKATLLATTAAAALLLLGSGAQAGTVKVGSIYGAYDAQCGSNIDCSLGTDLPVTVIGTDGSSPPSYGQYDTPSLFFVNQGTKPFTDLTVTATGYQGLSNGISQTISIPDVAPGTILDLVWARGYATPPGNLFAYDYDDEYGQTTSSTHCDPQGQGDCAVVGNFDIHVAGLLNGNPIASDFSPDNTQDGGNQQGTFVGWEGVDPQGFSESIYDDHSGTTPGVLAYIFTGTTGSNHPVPEPATLSLLAAGLGALAVSRRRRKSGARSST